MAYIYLGYGTTNNKGVATLDHDKNGNPLTHSYTGVGAGKINLIASLDDTITEDSIISPVSILWDTIFYDEATDDTKNTDYTASTDLTVTPSTDGKLLSHDASTTYVYYRLDETLNTPIGIEFDLTDATATNRCGIAFNNSTRYSFSSTVLDIPTESHVRIVYDGETVKTYLDNSTTVNSSVSASALTDFKFGFYIQANGNTMTFKNLKVYNG